VDIYVLSNKYKSIFIFLHFSLFKNKIKIKKEKDKLFQHAVFLVFLFYFNI